MVHYINRFKFSWKAHFYDVIDFAFKKIVESKIEHMDAHFVFAADNYDYYPNKKEQPFRVRTLAERSEARWNPSLKVFPSNSVNTKTPKFIQKKSIWATSGHDPMWP